MNSMGTTDIKSRFGTAVRSRRKRLGISQEELAGRAGLHRTYVADIERGARNLSLANIEKLATALDTTIPILFSQSETLLPKPALAGEAGEILLVEDDPADVELTLAAFKASCLTNPVRIARDGVEALDMLFSTGAFKDSRAFAPQVILLDLNLPKVNGLDVLRRIKADSRTRSIPVAVLSGSERNRDVEESRRLGAETYILKPVDFHRFTRVTPSLRLCWSLVKLKAA
jgi:CheY-like chemotaxis protein